MVCSNGTSDNLTVVRASLTCPNCRHELDCNLNLAGFPAGLRFNPSDQELLEHLESLVKGGGSGAHPLMNDFIPTIQGGNGICYTHPKNLPGVTRDGLSRHFFHRTSKAYVIGTGRQRRKIQSERGQCSSEDVVEAQWHKTGKTRPVIVGGRQKGWKKFLVLYNTSIKQRKPVKTNWVIHQYHLGMSEVEKDGEMVVSKVFYQTQTQQRCRPSATMPAHDQCIFAHAKMFQEVGAGDPLSDDEHVPSQRHVQSVPMEEPDTTLCL